MIYLILSTTGMINETNRKRVLKKFCWYHVSLKRYCSFNGWGGGVPSDHLYFKGDVKLEWQCSYSERAGTYQTMPRSSKTQAGLTTQLYKKFIFLRIMLIQSRTTSPSWISFVWQLVEVLFCQAACSFSFCLKLWNCPIILVRSPRKIAFPPLSLSLGNILWESVITNSC